MPTLPTRAIVVCGPTVRQRRVRTCTRSHKFCAHKKSFLCCVCVFGAVPRTACGRHKLCLWLHMAVYLNVHQTFTPCRSIFIVARICMLNTIRIVNSENYWGRRTETRGLWGLCSRLSRGWCVFTVPRAHISLWLFLATTVYRNLYMYIGEGHNATANVSHQNKYIQLHFVYALAMRMDAVVRHVELIKRMKFEQNTIISAFFREDLRKQQTKQLQ